MAETTVLVADDDAAIRTVLNHALTRAGFSVRVTSNSATLFQWANQGEGDCIVSDVIMPDGDAFEMVPKLLEIRPDLPIVLISAQNTFMTTLKAQEVGVYDYLPKPFDLDDLVAVVNRAVSEPKNNRPTQTSEEYAANMPLVGRSPQMQEIFRSIARLTTSDLPVFLKGESGTGKQLMARVLHEFSHRKAGPFIPVNLSVLPEDLIEKELFGPSKTDSYEKPGALLRAAGGTAYLNDVSYLPMSAQARLLRFLEGTEPDDKGFSPPVVPDVRIIASSSLDLEVLISSGQFREDLFYRINVVPIQLPPLRERRSDIADLARHFVKISEIENKQTRHLDEQALKRLREYDWPGNVRELENTMKRICTLYLQETISQSIVDAEISGTTGAKPAPAQMPSSSPSSIRFQGVRDATQHFVERYYDEYDGTLPPDGVYHRFLQEFEYPVLTAALEATNGNQVKAAKILGLNRNTLRKKIREHGIRIIKTAR